MLKITKKAVVEMLYDVDAEIGDDQFLWAYADDTPQGMQRNMQADWLRRKYGTPEAQDSDGNIWGDRNG